MLYKKSLETLLKRDSNTDMLLWILWKPFEHLFCRTPPGDCFWTDLISFLLSSVILQIFPKVFCNINSSNSYLFTKLEFSNEWSLFDVTEAFSQVKTDVKEKLTWYNQLQSFLFFPKKLLFIRNNLTLSSIIFFLIPSISAALMKIKSFPVGDLLLNNPESDENNEEIAVCFLARY